MTIKLLKGLTTPSGVFYSEGSIISDAEENVSDLIDMVSSGAAIEEPENIFETGAPRANLALSVDQLVAFCNRAVKAKWGYVWGGRGKVYNEAERDYLYRTYKTSKYDKTYFYTTQWKRWKGVEVCDCSGLFEAFSGENRTANSFYNKCTEKGKISTMPEIRGLLLFRYSSSSNKMVHIGMYEGGGKGIESKDSASGVVRTNVSARGWTHWGKASFLDYSIGAGETGASTGTTSPAPSLELARPLSLVSPYMRGSDVAGVQKALISHGFGVGESGADGVYGKDSYNATRSFQQANSLRVDGVVSEKTTEALGGIWLGQ